MLAISPSTMATTTRSHSRLTGIPGIETLYDFVQLRDQWQELDKPSADAYNEIRRQISEESRRSNDSPDSMAQQTSEITRLTEELTGVQQRYERDVALWEEERHRLAGQMLAIYRQCSEAFWAPMVSVWTDNVACI